MAQRQILSLMTQFSRFNNFIQSVNPHKDRLNLRRCWNDTTLMNPNHPPKKGTRNLIQVGSGKPLEILILKKDKKEFETFATFFVILFVCFVSLLFPFAFLLTKKKERKDLWAKC